MECVFTCFRYKGWKTDEKRATYAELSKSVPELSENGRIDPWWDTLDEKVNFGPWKVTISQIRSLVVKFEDLTSMTPQLSELAEMTLGNFKLKEKSQVNPLEFMTWQD